MDIALIRRLRNSFGANIYNQGVTVAVQVIGVPILLHAWGVQLYGEWLILSAIPSYLSMTDLGFSQSAGNDMVARVARDDRAGALAVFQSLGMLVYVLLVAGLVLSVLLLRYLPLENWFSFSVMSDDEVRWVIWLLIAEVLISLVDGINHAGFRSGGDYALRVGLYSTGRLVQFIGIWTVAIVDGGPVAAAAMFFSVKLITTIAFSLLLIYRHRWLRFGFLHAHAIELRRLIRPALANISVPLAQAINIQGMVLVVGTLLGPLSVVVFSTIRTLTRLVLQLVVAVCNAAELELATAYGVGNHELLQSLFIHALRISLWLALVSVASLILFGNAILDVWTQGRVAMQSTLFNCMLGAAMASASWYGALTVLKAANSHLPVAIIYVLASTGAVGMTVWLLAWTGDVVSAGQALLLMDIVMVLYTFYAVTKFLDTKLSVVLMRAANPLPLLAGVLINIRR